MGGILKDIVGGITHTIFGKPSGSKEQSTSTSSSSSGNYAFPYLLSSVAPATQYLQKGGNMLGALLGVDNPGVSTSAPVPNNPVAPVAGYPSGPVTSSYSGPTLSQIMGMQGNKKAGQSAINSYFNYYMAHPEEDPGFNDISMFHGDAYKDEDSASRVLSARQAYLRNNPQGAAVQFPTTVPDPVTSVTGTPAVTPAPATGDAPSTPQESALDTYSESAGAKFLREQGVKAIESSQAAKGLLQSGATGTALEKFGQGLAQTYLNQYLDHLLSYAQLGNTSAGILSSAGNYSNSTGASGSSGSSSGAKEGLLQILASSPAASSSGG